MSKVNRNVLTIRISLNGILLFCILYYISSTLYPGGSQADLNSVGFSWMDNYWCNLMNEKAMNEDINPARPVAISAMVILCLSICLFFVQFARVMSSTKLWKHVITICGIMSMCFAALMFTELHDLMTSLSSIVGLVAIMGVIREIYLSKLKVYKFTGIVCLILLALNNYIYYTEHMIGFLPFLQKVTLLLVLIWIVGLNIVMERRIQLNRIL